MTAKPQSVLNIRLPVWRARLLVTLMFLGFMALAARALYCQSVNKDFLQATQAEHFLQQETQISHKPLLWLRPLSCTLKLPTRVRAEAVGSTHLTICFKIFLVVACLNNVRHKWLPALELFYRKMATL